MKSIVLGGWLAPVVAFGVLLHAVPAISAAAPSPDSLIALAQRHSPSLAALRARVQAARERVRPAGALPDPSLEVMLQDVDFPRWTVGEETVIELSQRGRHYDEVLNDLRTWLTASNITAEPLAGGKTAWALARLVQVASS